MRKSKLFKLVTDAPPDPVLILFDKYINLRKPLQKTTPKLSKLSREMIENALSIVTFEELCLIIDYFTKSTDDYVLFMRGKNECEKDYVRLDNLTRVTKLKEKLSRAKQWKKKTSKEDGGYVPPVLDTSKPFLPLPDD